MSCERLQTDAMSTLIWRSLVNPGRDGPAGRLRSTATFKRRPREIGINRAELHFDRGGLRIKTGGLSGGEVDSLLLSPPD